MRTSANGLALIKQFEGLRLQVYKDAAGLATIGYGHKITSDEGEALAVLINGKWIPYHTTGIADAQANALLQSDVDKVDAAMNAQHLALDLNQNQWDAVADFAFNCGTGALVKLLAHGIDQIPAQLPRWCHAGGQELPGMVTRRAAEVELYNTIPT